MTSKTTTTVTCDQCGGSIRETEGNPLSFAGLSGPGWWVVNFAEARDGKWNADLCSRTCLAKWIDGWREKPKLSVVE